jgi:hypothetical protein
VPYWKPGMPFAGDLVMNGLHFRLSPRDNHPSREPEEGKRELETTAGPGSKG